MPCVRPRLSHLSYSTSVWKVIMCTSVRFSDEQIACIVPSVARRRRPSRSLSVPGSTCARRASSRRVQPRNTRSRSITSTFADQLGRPSPRWPRLRLKSAVVVGARRAVAVTMEAPANTPLLWPRQEWETRRSSGSGRPAYPAASRARATRHGGRCRTRARCAAVRQHGAQARRTPGTARRGPRRPRGRMARRSLPGRASHRRGRWSA